MSQQNCEHYIDVEYKISKTQAQLTENLIFCLNNLIVCLRDRKIFREGFDLRNSIEFLLGSELGSIDHSNLDRIIKFLSMPSTASLSGRSNMDILKAMLKILKDQSVLILESGTSKNQTAWIERSCVAAQALEKQLAVH